VRVSCAVVWPTVWMTDVAIWSAAFASGAVNREVL
jgi:hypothetical protein